MHTTRALILSEITRMGPGHCVIGIEAAAGAYRSVRPFPPAGFAWPTPFRHHRGEKIEIRLTEMTTTPPHTEDLRSLWGLKTIDRLEEAALVGCLRQAEVAGRLKDLFGCDLHQRPHGSVFTQPGRGSRSICGCEFQNIRLELEMRTGNAEQKTTVRAALTLPSGESLRDLPVVDRDWNEWIEQAAARLTGANRLQRLSRFLSTSVRDQLLGPSHRFARIGLSRPYQDVCWLMLDSLFPLPQASWLGKLS